MCDLDDFGVPVTIHAADAVECRCSHADTSAARKIVEDFKARRRPTPEMARKFDEWTANRWIDP